MHSEGPSGSLPAPGDERTAMTTDSNNLRDELLSQIGSGGWPLLRAHAKSGSLVLVQPNVPLLDAALAIAHDRTDLVGAWIDDGSLHRQYPPADSEVDTLFNFVVVGPYVLAQPLSV